MDKKVFNNDDYCDVYNGKICDNCGDCLEMQGIDTKAIRIADIAKEVEENKKIEETLKKLAEEKQEEMEDNLEEELTTETWEEYLAKQDEYEDAFDHIEYLEDIDLNDDLTMEEMTEEVFPGVRKLKIKECFLYKSAKNTSAEHMFCTRIFFIKSRNKAILYLLKD